MNRLSWPALLLAPLVALAQQSVVYALVTPSCAEQSRTALHVVSVVAFLLALAMTVFAWNAWRAQRAAAGSGDARPTTLADGPGASQRPSFVDLMAVLVGSLSALVCLVIWMPIWVLSPCS